MYNKENFRRYFAIEGLEVSDKGSVRRSYKDKHTTTGWSLYPHKLVWQTDDEGNVIVNTKDHGDLRVDELVAKCFWGNPRGEKTYLIHLDKDKMNCSMDNLQWVTREEFNKFYEDDPVINTEDGFRKVSYGLYVSRDGKVRESKKGKLMKVYYSMPEYETAREVEIGPHVVVYKNGNYYPSRVHIDELVAEAYLPQPQGRYMKVLHKDNDYKNCALDNLEWADWESEKYQQYMEQRQKDVDARNAELNPPREIKTTNATIETVASSKSDGSV